VDEYHCLPPAYTVDAAGKPLHSWRTLILPYIEKKKLYDEIDLSKPWDNPVNRAAYETNLSFYHCPSGNAGKSQTTYLAVVAPGGCFQPTEPRTLSEITDGTSRTLIVIEVPDEQTVHWMSPHDASEELILNLFKKGKPPHPNGTMAAFVDGHTFLLPRNTTPEVLRALISVAGNDNDVARAVD
jgi:prepilin-type processing-associated H-X9-DG protein